MHYPFFEFPFIHKQIKNLKNLLSKHIKVHLKRLKGQGQAVRYIFGKFKSSKNFKNSPAGWVGYFSSPSLGKDKIKVNSIAT